MERVKELSNTSQKYTKAISFTITPISRWCQGAERILNELDKGDMDQVAKILDDFTKMKHQLTKLQKTDFAQDYPNKYGVMLVDIGKNLIYGSSVI